MTHPDGFVVNGQMYPARSRRVEKAMSERIEELEARELGLIATKQEDVKRIKELEAEVKRLEAKIAAAIAIGYASSGWAVYGQMKKALEAGNEETKDQ